MYTDTITLFNRHKSGTGDIWYPSILEYVNLNMDRASITAKYGAESKSNAVLNVRYRTVDGKKTIGDKIWLSPKEWQKQSDDLINSTLTFASGQLADFFITGKYESELPVMDSDYKDGFYNYMNKTYDEVFVITESAFYSTIPHFEIMAK